MTDTTPEAAKVQIEIYRRMSGVRRLALAFEMSEFARDLCRAGIRGRHPEWSEAEVRREVIRLTMLPDPLPEPLR